MDRHAAAGQGLLFDEPPDRTAPIGAVDAWAWAQHSGAVVGLDEAGRGPLAGPVVAAAACLGVHPPAAGLSALNDSKKLTATTRARLAMALARSATVGVGVVSPARIDEVNILEATREAMRLALARLRDVGPPAPWLLLVDGHLPVPGYAEQQIPLVKGDGRSLAIAAASIVAKEARDQLMRAYDRRWPMYGFAQHKGYGTIAHRRALAEHGPCPIHRASFSWTAPDD